MVVGYQSISQWPFQEPKLEEYLWNIYDSLEYLWNVIVSNSHDSGTDSLEVPTGYIRPMFLGYGMEYPYKICPFGNNWFSPLLVYHQKNHLTVVSRGSFKPLYSSTNQWEKDVYGCGTVHIPTM